MNTIHAIALFLFASRAFYGFPNIIYYQAEIAAVLIYILLAIVTSAPAARHLHFFVFTALLFFCALVSAVLANINFNQPLILGILARRDIFVSVIPAYFLIYHLGSSKTERVMRRFILLAKLYIVSLFVLSLTIDPVTINDALSGDDQLRLYFVDFSASFSAYRLKLSPLPGLIYLVYFLSDRKKNYSDFCVLVVFYVWLFFFYGGRIAIASIIILYVALAIRSVRTKRGLAKVGLSVNIIIMLIISGFMFMPEVRLESRIEGFSQAINAISGIDSSNLSDVSSLSRASQYLQLNSRLDVIDYFFGLGQLSNQWDGGFDNIFGRFHPSDLGIYGFIGIFGVFGLIILLMVLWIVFPPQIARNKNFTPLLVFLLVYSVPTGLVLFQPPLVLVCMLVLVGVGLNFSAARIQPTHFRIL